MVLAVALTGDGRLLASGSIDGTVKLWEAARWAAVGHAAGPHGSSLGSGAERGWAAAGRAAAWTGRSGCGRCRAGSRWPRLQGHTGPRPGRGAERGWAAAGQRRL